LIDCPDVYNRDDLLSYLFHPVLAGVFFDRLHPRKAISECSRMVSNTNLYSAGDKGYIDTLGEACFRAGDCAMAIYNGNLLTQLNPRVFPQALKTWEKNEKDE
jgi:hypothetical protein